MLQKDGFFRKRDDGLFNKSNSTTPATAPAANTAPAPSEPARYETKTDERKEATDHYEGVLADHAKQKQESGQQTVKYQTGGSGSESVVTDPQIHPMNPSVAVGSTGFLMRVL